MNLRIVSVNIFAVLASEVATAKPIKDLEWTSFSPISEIEALKRADTRTRIGLIRRRLYFKLCAY